MDNLLLSIVVPTKNRTEYVISMIKMIYSLNDKRIELIIQDNSDDNDKIISFLNKGNYNFVKYYYDGSSMDLVENSELGISHATAKYVCFMGDDDIVTSGLSDFVELMDAYGYESAVFSQNSAYFWPGTIHRAHKFPNLSIEKYKGKITEVNVRQEFRRLLQKSATTMLWMPQLYHGVVRRDCLDKIKLVAGCYFPGPCPDMAICVALSYVVKKHIYCDLPLVVSGVAPKSAAALGAKHEHKDKIENVKTLPPNTARDWEETIPKIWTWVTIYGESAIKSMRHMKREKDIKYFNFTKFYAYFYVFCYEFRDMVKPYVRNMVLLQKIQYYIYVAASFTFRSYYFVKNIIRTRTRDNSLSWDYVANSYEAEKIIDEMMKDVNLNRLFYAQAGR